MIFFTKRKQTTIESVARTGIVPFFDPTSICFASYGAGFDSVNPAAFFTDSVENNTRFLMDLYARERSYEEFRTTGVHRIRLDIPDQVKQLKMVAYYNSIDLGDQTTQAETIAYSAFSPLDR